MRRRQSSVVRFSRDYRRPPKWGMGLPPAKKLRRRIPVLVWLAAIVFLALVLPPVVDAVKGFATPSQGCKVWQVTDGDTVRIYCADRTPTRARIIGYDTPELFSPNCFWERVMAARAAVYLRWQLWTARQVRVQVRGTDRYVRALIRLEFDGEDISRTMIAAGLGIAYSGGRRIDWCVRAGG